MPTEQEKIDTTIGNAVESGVKSYRSDNESADAHSLKDMLDARDRIKADQATQGTNRRGSIQSIFAKIRPVS